LKCKGSVQSQRENTGRPDPDGELVTGVAQLSAAGELVEITLRGNVRRRRRKRNRGPAAVCARARRLGADVQAMGRDAGSVKPTPPKDYASFQAMARLKRRAVELDGLRFEITSLQMSSVPAIFPPTVCGRFERPGRRCCVCTRGMPGVAGERRCWKQRDRILRPVRRTILNATGNVRAVLPQVRSQGGAGRKRPCGIFRRGC